MSEINSRIFTLLALAGLSLAVHHVHSAEPDRAPTYHEDVAPILFKHCAGCHRPGQAAPFSLLDFNETRKHARHIVKATATRFMPPWLPEHGYGNFAHERRLTTNEIRTIQRWVEGGGQEGDPAQAPKPPVFHSTWQLGEPDLVVKLPPYTLIAEGRDVYHNFVAPIPVPARKFVKGVEFLPGNARVVHHAFIQTDETGQSMRMAAQQNPPGFDGMELPESASMPGGHLLGWQPGKVPYLSSDRLAWVLRTNTDLVLQAHLNPSGKPEIVQPSVGFFFTDLPPTNSPFRIKLTTLELDIPPGVSNYVAAQSYTVPVNLQLLRVSGHAHYLCKEMQGYATLPGGEKKWLLWIKRWDFNWQGDYEYAEPVYLPKGSVIHMRYVYDNSTNNVRNPNNPPKTVRFGMQTSDEMGELFFQSVTIDPQDYNTLRQDYSKYFLQVSMDYFRFRTKVAPNDWHGHFRLGRALGATGQTAESIKELSTAIQLNPAEDKPRFDLGMVLLRQGQLGQAEEQFKSVIKLNPKDSQAFGCLGIICLQGGRIPEAEVNFQKAVSLNPDDTLARKYLDLIHKKTAQ